MRLTVLHLLRSALCLALLAAPPTHASTDLPLEPQRRIQFETDAGSWLALDLSPDDRSIVFDVLGDIYLISASGGRAQRLTAGMAFDTQPVWSPDGTAIAFVSDRSGSDNLWISGARGENPRRVSDREDYSILTSPAWGADGRYIYVSSYRTGIAGFEIWRYPAAGTTQQGELLVPAKAPDGSDPSRSSVGAWPSADGRFLYFARNLAGARGDASPAWTIVRRELRDGSERTEIAAPPSPRPDLVAGNYFRPALSPDGRQLLYATQHEGKTGLRIRDLQSLVDRWLIYPVQRDQIGAAAFRDLQPRYDFTADGRDVIYASDGHIYRYRVADRSLQEIPFTADIDLGVGPDLRVDIEQETGPVRARIIQAPVSSPDGKRVAFSALGKIYVMDLRAGAKPRRLTRTDHHEFMPNWSADGKHITYVTWTARDAGDVWLTRADGTGKPRNVSVSPAFYTSPVFAPDGAHLIAIRSSHQARMHSYMEYGLVRDAELLELPIKGGDPRVILREKIGGVPQFTADAAAAFINFADGLHRVALDGSGHRKAVGVVGPGWYFAEGPAPVDDLKISPDGKWALALIAQQLHLIEVPSAADGPPVDVRAPAVRHRKITDVGADFFDWSDGGRSITWAVGSTFYRRPFAQISLDAPGQAPRGADAPEIGSNGVEAYQAIVELPRDTPRGALVLRGATAITMKGEQAIDNADVLIVDDRIAAVGPSGTLTLPRGATIRDVSGRFIIPGLIDEHDHYADVRRGVLDFETWGPRANLAYGVTTGFDPSTLSIDMLAYQDAVDAGLMVGSRMPSTGMALFSFNEFRSLDEVRAVLRRYRDHYRTRNLKQYRVGNRRVRQWVAIAARELGMLPTTEGAGSAELDLTQIIDGYAGSERALPIVPLSRDIVELIARTRVAYSTTLMISPEPEGQDYFIARQSLIDDAKLNRFSPRFIVNLKTRQRMRRELSEYLFPAVAMSATAILRAGGLIGMGSHGEMPGIGLHWELQAHVMGGMTPLEALRAATMGSAETIGRKRELGSIEPGKYADLVILERDPRTDIRDTLSIAQVMKNGRLYDGNTLNELWPRQRSLPEPWFRNDVPPPLPAEEHSGAGMHAPAGFCDHRMEGTLILRSSRPTPAAPR